MTEEEFKKTPEVIHLNAVGEICAADEKHKRVFAVYQDENESSCNIAAIVAGCAVDNILMLVKTMENCEIVRKLVKAAVLASDDADLLDMFKAMKAGDKERSAELMAKLEAKCEA